MNDYYANLPKKRMGSGILFFNAAGHILIVKPTYKDVWDIPGGVTEADESPRTTMIRELGEELGQTFLSAFLKRTNAVPPPLLSVDYIDGSDGKGDRLMFIFDGGTLDAAELALITLATKELAEYRLAPLEEALTLLSPRLKNRIASSVAARHNGQSGVYLEGGV